MAVFGGTFRMLGSSWRVLQKDPEILLFFFLSIAAKLGLAGWTYQQYVLLYPDGMASVAAEIQNDGTRFYLSVGGVVVAYHGIGQFFNAAVVGSAARRLSGRNPNVLTGIFDALLRLPSLLLWSVVVAALLTLTGLFKKKGRLQKWIGGSVQAAFHVLTFFVLPLIMIENAFPLTAMGRSAALLGRTWGQQLTANVSLFVFRFLMTVPGLALAAYGLKLPDTEPPKPVFIGAGAVAVVLAAAVIQTLTEIYRTALYLFARDHRAPQGFSTEQLQTAFQQQP